MHIFTLVFGIMYTIICNYCIKLCIIPYYFFYCDFVLFCHWLHFLFVGIICVSVWVCNMCDGDVSEYTCAHDMAHLWKWEEDFKNLIFHCLGTTDHTQTFRHMLHVLILSTGPSCLCCFCIVSWTQGFWYQRLTQKF